MIVNLDWMGAAAPKKKIGEFFPVTVPGDIQSDYAKHMGWGDFNYMNNCKKYEEISSSKHTPAMRITAQRISLFHQSRPYITFDVRCSRPKENRASATEFPHAGIAKRK